MTLLFKSQVCRVDLRMFRQMTRPTLMPTLWSSLLCFGLLWSALLCFTALTKIITTGLDSNRLNRLDGLINSHKPKLCISRIVSDTTSDLYYKDKRRLSK